MTRTLLRACFCLGLCLAAPGGEAAGGGVSPADRDFWAFRPLGRPALPGWPAPPESGAATAGAASPIDLFLLDRLRARGLDFGPEAGRPALIRRASLDLLGLPPAPEEIDAFLADPAPDAFDRLAERLLASPRHGERRGRAWLDTAGYSDSNGYHRNDTHRPLAWRYRDYVIQSLNADKPYDRFLLEQLAGDELVDYHNAGDLAPEEVDALVATHFLRNGPDGTDSTEGNETARTIERYAALEAAEQIAVSTLFGLTIDCARCHDHKFDPIPQRDYYALQAVFYPAFNVKEWVQPKDRWIHAAGKAEIGRWRAANDEADRLGREARRAFEAWLAARPPAAGTALWVPDLTGGAGAPALAAEWSDAAPGDALAAGTPRVTLDGDRAPAARAGGGRLELLAAGDGASVWLSSRRSFDWTPERIGGWIQATFELAADRAGGSGAAKRIGHYIALHDRDDDGPVAGGNLLIDGNPAGGAEVHLDYPGKDARRLGTIGTGGYRPGRRHGVRLTRAGDDEYLLAHVVDGRVEENMLTLAAADIPDGGFGFELCCGRSFTVARVAVESSRADAALAAELVPRRQARDEAVRAAESRRRPEPGKIAWVTDITASPPPVHVLTRGDYFNPGPAVEPGPLGVLSGPGEDLDVRAPFPAGRSTGRRLAFARWATRPGSRAAALAARVEANRIWHGHFGRGLVETPGNFGRKGAPPSHPELLEWLAVELVEGGWRLKRLHRAVLLSRAYRQASAGREPEAGADPDNRLLWAYPARRLEAEAMRDSMLAAAGLLQLSMGGPPVAFEGRPDGQVVLADPAGTAPGPADRRTIYITHRRSEPLSFLQAFDLAALDPNCTARATSAVVSQALAMLNGEFALRVARSLAARLEREAGGVPGARVARAYLLALARPPSAPEIARALAFLENQARLYAAADGAPGDAARRALADFCDALLASNEFAYLE